MARTKKFDEETVLMKAMELFWKKGFHATSIQDLVDHLGINRASLYSTYGGKESLFIQALTKYRELSAGTVEEMLGDMPGIKEAVRHFLFGVIEDSRKDPDRKGCFIANSAIDLAPENTVVCDFAHQNQADFIKRFSDLFQSGIESGELDPSNEPEVLALYVFNAVNGLRVLAKTIQDFDQLKAIADTTLRAIY